MRVAVNVCVTFRGWAPLSGVIAGREKYIDLPIEEIRKVVADPNGDDARQILTLLVDRIRAVRDVADGVAQLAFLFHPELVDDPGLPYIELAPRALSPSE